jgi:transposase
MKTSHFEERSVRHLGSPATRRREEAWYGESAQDGDDRFDSDVAAAGLVLSKDCPRAGGKPRDGVAVSASGCAQNRPNPSAGSGSNPAIAPTGSGEVEDLGITLPVPIRAGPVSHSEPFRAVIQAKLEQGLSAQRIYQDLAGENGFEGSYYSVQRMVRALKAVRPLPFRRMECAPGEQAQIDFGTGAPIISPDGKRRCTHVFRIVLSHSRKAYSEVVYRQTTDAFIGCIENAFRCFGGVPRTLVIDNLKAAVSQADWFDPDLNPKMRSFCEHYGTVLLPTRPYTPRHKGKIDRSIGYVKNNALKGRTFKSLEEQNRHLMDWERSVADTRIHGTTRQQASKVFEEVERATLLPLPVERFPCFQEGRRKVNRDGHVEVDKAYYSAPPEYLGREVWVRWDSHVVRIFNAQVQQIAIHVRHEPGRFSTQDRHIDPKKRSGVERGSAWLLSKAGLIGPATAQWAEQMVQQRGIEGVRVLMGLLHLSRRHACELIEQACATATTHGAYRLRTVRELIKRQAPRQERFEFIDEHPIIRSLTEYGALVHTSFNKEPWR